MLRLNGSDLGESYIPIGRSGVGGGRGLSDLSLIRGCEVRREVEIDCSRKRNGTDRTSAAVGAVLS